MNFRLVSLGAVASILLVLNATAFAAKDTDAPTHDGKIVNITSSKLVMTSKGGKGDKDNREHTHSLLADTKMTLDGKACKVDDLKTGMKIRVTTKPGDMKVAIHIEAIDKDLVFANTHDGKVVTATSTKLVMTDKNGTEHSHVVSVDTKVTCDGKDCKASDLKTGMKIRVTTLKSDVGAASEIEALEKDTEFASL